MGKVRTLAPPRGGCNLSPLLCGSGFRVEPSRDLDLKQFRSSAAGDVTWSGQGIWTSTSSSSAGSRRFWAKSRAWTLARSATGPTGFVSCRK